MKGDFSRFLYDPKKRYTRVLRQQGRVDLDADWNDQVEIQEELNRNRTLDVIGTSGAFRVAGSIQPFDLGLLTLEDVLDLSIAPGKIYVDGIFCQLDEPSTDEAKPVTYLNQPDLIDPPTIRVGGWSYDLAYLDVWERHITYLEDGDIRETALGGPDTTTRVKTIWQLKLIQGFPAYFMRTHGLELSQIKEWQDATMASAGLLSIRSAEEDASSSLYLESSSDSLGVSDNRLHRVEIHFGGEFYEPDELRSMDEEGIRASCTIKVLSAAEGTLTVSFDKWIKGSIEWQSGQPVVLLVKNGAGVGGDSGSDSLEGDASSVSYKRGRLLSYVTSIDRSSFTLNLKSTVDEIGRWMEAIGYDSTSIIDLTVHIVPIATFKWSRDNACLAYEGYVLKGSQRKVKLVLSAGNPYLSLEEGDLVEVQTEEDDLNGMAGVMARIASGGIDKSAMTITLDRDLVRSVDGTSPLGYDDLPEDLKDRVKVRRWDITGEVLLDGSATDIILTPDEKWLEGSIMIGFSGRNFRPGDYWSFESRGGTVKTLQNLPSMGIKHHYAPIGFLKWSNDGGVITAQFERLMPEVPTLSSITGDDVMVTGVEDCLGTDFGTVSEVIGYICSRFKGPCNVVVKPCDAWRENIYENLQRLSSGQASSLDVKICFLPGTYDLDSPLTFNDLGHVRLQGSGPGTRFIAQNYECAVAFSNCKTVHVDSIYAESGLVGFRKERGLSHLNGTLTFSKCNRVNISDVELKCAEGTQKAGTCITVRDASDYSDDVVGNDAKAKTPVESVVIKDCNLHVGHMQTGILLINVDKTHVESNHIEVAQKSDSLNMSRMLESSAYRAAVRKLMLQDMVLNPSTKLTDIVTTSDTETDIGTATTLPSTPTTSPSTPITSTSTPSEGAADHLVKSIDAKKAAVSITNTRSELNVVKELTFLNKNKKCVEVDVRGEKVSFKSEAVLADAWKSVIVTNKPTSVTSKADFQSWIKKVADDSLKNPSAEAYKDLRFFTRELFRNDRSMGLQGITLGGNVSSEIRIENNTLIGFVQGIHIGLSHRIQDERSIEADIVGMVQITGNRIDVIHPVLNRERHGIFVGNFETLVLENNRICVESLYRSGVIELIEAVRVYGKFGHMMAVRQNLLNGATIGVRLMPVGRKERDSLWIVAYNAAPGSQKSLVYPVGMENQIMGKETNSPKPS